jgi:phosphoribosyl-AMP cyclohydrolase
VTYPAPLSHAAQDETLELRPRFNADGLVAAIAQDADTGDVLMLAWMNDQALEQTLATGRAVYWSRSRNELWRKGDTSGHEQHIVEVRVDCDQDAVLLKVRQTGAACHTGRRSCFYRVASGVRLHMEENRGDPSPGPSALPQP